MIVTCDNCQKDFMVAVKEKNLGKGIIESFFTCRHCEHRYPVTMTNAPIRKRIEHFNKEWLQMNRLKDNGAEWKKDSWLLKYTKLQAYKAKTDTMINKLKVEVYAK